MASAVQQLLPWRRKTLTVSGKEPHFSNCTYLGPVPVLDAHNTYTALRAAWKRHRESRGLVGCQVALRLKLNRLEMSYVNNDSDKQDFYLHRIVTCQNSLEPPTPPPESMSLPISSGDEEEEKRPADSAFPLPPDDDDEPPPSTLVAWTYRHEHKRARVIFKAHVVNFHSPRRSADFHTSMTDKLVFSLEEYRRERLQRQTSRARMVRTRSVDSGLQRRRKDGGSPNNNSTPLRKTTLSAARNFKPEAKGAPKLQQLDEASDEEDEQTDTVAGNARRLSRLGIALLD